MAQRLNPYTAAPDGIAALGGVEAYLQKCGLDPKLIALIKTRVSQINGCAYCLHIHTEEARKFGETEARLYLLDAWHESNLYSARERAALPRRNRSLILRRPMRPMMSMARRGATSPKKSSQSYRSPS